MAKKLTVSFLKGMAPNTEVRDTLAEGLAARTRAGSLSFVFLFQLHGKRFRRTLGRWGGDDGHGLTLDEARNRANAMRADLGNKRLPHSVTTEIKTVNDLLDRYVAHLEEGTKRPEQATYLLDKHVRPKVGAFALDSLRRRDVQELVDKIRPVSIAGAVARYFTAAMNFGESRDLIERGIGRLHMPESRNPPRQTVLPDTSIGTMLKDWMPKGPDVFARHPFGTMCTLLLLTGARRSEIGELAWTELDLDRGLISLSPERSKGGRETLIVLSSYALRIARALPRHDEMVAFPSLKKRETPGKETARPGRAGRGFWSGWGRATDDSRTRTKIEDWSPHSLRRTCRTGLSRLGVAPHVASAVLNHAKPHLDGIYDKYEFVDERRAALELWGAEVFGLAGW